MFTQNVLVAQVNSIIKFCKSKGDLDDFRPVAVAQAFVLFSSKYALNALVNHLWANMIKVIIETWVEIRMLLRKNQNRFECFSWLFSYSTFDCFAYFWPTVWSIISIKINYLLHYKIVFVDSRIFFVWLWKAVVLYLVQIGLVSLTENNINGLMRLNFWMQRAVVLLVIS